MLNNIINFVRGNWDLIKNILIIILIAEVINMFSRWLKETQLAVRKEKFVLDNVKKGKQGEKLVAKELKSSKYENSYVFNDVFLKEDDKIIAQVDHILVSPKGIYVIETKNWQGMVENLDFNTIIRNNGKEYKTYKPTNQNRRHKIKLERLIDYKMVKDVVIFTKVKYMKPNDASEKMCNIDDFYRYYYKNAEDILTPDEVNYYVEKIKCVISQNKKENNKYIENLKKQNKKDLKEIREMYKKDYA